MKIEGLTVLELEGHSIEHQFKGEVEARGGNWVTIDQLYLYPEKIKEVVSTPHDILFLSTTGLYHDKLDMLVEAFTKLKYAPKYVIFDSEQSAMALLGVARNYKEKYGTKFYWFYSWLEEELEEIIWI